MKQSQSLVTKLFAPRTLLVSALLVGAALAVPRFAHAAALEQFKSFVSSTQAARGEFTQQLVKVDSGNTKVSNKSTGTFTFARPGKFIWTYQKPYEQLLQADGDKLYILSLIHI